MVHHNNGCLLPVAQVFKTYFLTPFHQKGEVFEMLEVRGVTLSDDSAGHELTP
jgi:hypothetical protein